MENPQGIEVAHPDHPGSNTFIHESALDEFAARGMVPVNGGAKPKKSPDKNPSAAPATGVVPETNDPQEV